MMSELSHLNKANISHWIKDTMLNDNEPIIAFLLLTPRLANTTLVKPSKHAPCVHCTVHFNSWLIILWGFFNGFYAFS